jgi:aryl-alcohol dehydrogenase-like predicted oxidoreductase
MSRRSAEWPTIDAGINFLDNAREYHEGESERRMGRAIADRRGAVFLMTKSLHARPRRLGRHAPARAGAASNA